MNISEQYDDRSVKQLVYPAVIFLWIGMLIGTFISFNTFIFPDYFAGEYVTFGRLRPMHVQHVAVLWLLTGGMGVFYYIVQRLCGVRLWSSSLAEATNTLWLISAIIGVYSFPWGTNSGWEYAEIPMWVGFLPIKPMLTVAWVMFCTNILMTIRQRIYPQMYVSLWYVIGTLVWTTVTWIIGNYIIHIAPEGITRVNLNFFFVHNLVGLIFTPFGLAATYYFIPRASSQAIYSHKLSMVGFWSIAFVYSWVGSHHIIHGPMAQWLQTVSIVFSIWLFVPVWTVIINFFYTLKDSWQQYNANVTVRFLMMGTLFYLMTSVQGSFMALRSVNEITSKTDWVIGHAHLALLGAFTFFLVGAVYHLIPVVTSKPLWSARLAAWHFRLMLLGSMLMFSSLMVGGFFQGLEWATWTEGSTYAHFQRQLALLPFIDTVAHMKPWWMARSLSGVILLLANSLFAVNIFNTIILNPSQENTNEVSS